MRVSNDAWRYTECYLLFSLPNGVLWVRQKDKSADHKRLDVTIQYARLVSLSALLAYSPSVRGQVGVGPKLRTLSPFTFLSSLSVIPLHDASAPTNHISAGTA